MNKEYLEVIANNFLIEGISIRTEDIELARNYTGFSWGINRYLERMQFMTLCTRLLGLLEVPKHRLREYQNKGYDRALDLVNKMKFLERKLGF